MVEYEVQTLLIELTLQDNNMRNLKQLTNFVLELILSNPKFWIQNSETWKEAREKDKEVQ